MTRTKAKENTTNNNDMSQDSPSTSSSSSSSNGSGVDILNTETMRFKFEARDKVLCYHGPMLYNSTVLDRKMTYEPVSGDVVPYYRIHYDGWNAKWDEWVPDSRVLEMTEENISLQNTFKQDLYNRPSAVSARAQANANNDASSVPMPADITPQVTTETFTLTETITNLSENGPKDAPLTNTLQQTNPQTLKNDTNNAESQNVNKTTSQNSQNDINTTIQSTLSATTQNDINTTTQNTINATSQNATNSSAPVLPRRRKRKQPVEEETTTSTSTATDTTSSTNAMPATSTTTSSSVTATSPTSKINSTPQVKTNGLNGQNAQNEHNGQTAKGTNQHQRKKRCRINIDVSDNTMVKLIDDWEWITCEYQLVPLPKSKPVNVILEDFLLHKLGDHDKGKSSLNGTRSRNRRTPKNPEEDALREALDGLKAYFNEMLGAQLLYRAERQQYYNLKEKNERLECSAIYGAEHLMRLFAVMPRCVEAVEMTEAKAEHLREICQELVNFLESHVDEYFAEIYENATPMYIRLSENF